MDRNRKWLLTGFICLTAWKLFPLLETISRRVEWVSVILFWFFVLFVLGYLAAIWQAPTASETVTSGTRFETWVRRCALAILVVFFIGHARQWQAFDQMELILSGTALALVGVGVLIAWAHAQDGRRLMWRTIFWLALVVAGFVLLTPWGLSGLGLAALVGFGMLNQQQ